MPKPRQPRESGLYKLGEDGALHPLTENTPHTTSAQAAGPDGEDMDERFPLPQSHYRIKRMPANRYEFLIEAGERFGIPVMLLFVVLIGGGYAGWKLINWNRDDQKVFIQAVEKNTTAIDKLSDGQDKQTDALNALKATTADMKKSLDDHLNQEHHR